MIQEYFFSGYCRCIDNSRMVAVETDNGSLTEVDCNYVNCPYAPGCSVAEKIRELTKP